MYKKAFTAVEVMISLLVAALLIITGYGLYSYVYNETSIARNRAVASNIAEAHLKKRIAISDTTDCVTGDNWTDEAPFDGEKLKGLLIKTKVECPYPADNTAVSSLIKVTSVVTYKVNNVDQVETQVLYAEK